METLILTSKVTIIQVIRYLILAGGSYLIIYYFASHFFKKFRIQNVEITNRQLIFELRNSFISSILFGLIFTCLIHPSILPRTKIYTENSSYPSWWFWTSLIFLILINDTYFYWMHRALHLKRAFRLAHHTHHVSTNPTPLASYSFHPIETFLEAIWIFPVAFLIPIHLNMLIIYSLVSFINDVRGHFGVDLLPLKIKKMFPFSWINSATHHSFHHKYFNSNYGLYFLFWDRLCSTERTEIK